MPTRNGLTGVLLLSVLLSGGRLIHANPASQSRTVSSSAYVTVASFFPKDLMASHAYLLLQVHGIHATVDTGRGVFLNVEKKYVQEALRLLKVDSAARHYSTFQVERPTTPIARKRRTMLLPYRAAVDTLVSGVPFDLSVALRDHEVVNAASEYRYALWIDCYRRDYLVSQNPTTGGYLLSHMWEVDLVLGEEIDRSSRRVHFGFQVDHTGTMTRAPWKYRLPLRDVSK